MRTETRDLVVVLWTDAFILIARNNDVTGAPLSSSSSSFWDKLYQNASSQNCLLLPKVTSEKYFKTKVDLACSNNGTPASTLYSGIRNDSVGICNSIQDLFTKLCKLSSTSSASYDTALDPMNFDSLGAEAVCSSLDDLIKTLNQTENTKMSSEMSQTWLVPFSTNRTISKLQCTTLCKNSGNKSIPEDTLRVNPLCILLLQGYTTYQHQQSVSSLINTSNSNGPTHVSSISPSHNGNKATEEIPVKTKKNEISSLAPSDDKPSEKISNTASSYPLKTADEQLGTTRSGINEIGQSQSAVTQQDVPMKPEAQKESANPIPELDKMVSISDSSSVKNNDEANNNNVQVSKAVSKASSTTAATVEDNRGNNDLPLPPSADGKKLKQSSTAIPKEIIVPQGNSEKINAKPDELADNNPTADESIPVPAIPDKTPLGQLSLPEKPKQLEKPITSKKLEDDGLASIGEDDAEYNGATGMEDGNGRPPLKSEIDNDIDIPAPDTQNLGYDSESPFKISKSRFSGSNGIPFESHGTTINVSLNESEDTGFFSYFLFCVTLIGLVYLIIHNKKKLIAFVVEGKRPRTRARRSSSGQYRKLENNFD